MATIDTTVTAAQMQMEEGLRFGPGVTNRFEQSFPIENITGDNAYNHRLAGGMVVAGVKVDRDLRNIAGMVADIKALGAVKEPLTLSERDDGTFVLLRGFRRYNASMTIRRDDPSSPLAHRLKFLPCVIFRGLSPQLERDLVNDQTAKDFSRAEVFQIFREQIEGGYNWKTVCNRMYQQIGRVSSVKGVQKIRELDAINDPIKKEKELTAWLTTFAYQFWAASIRAGRKFADAVMQTHMYEDGALERRPEVMMNALRMKKLTAAVSKDQGNGKYNQKECSGPETDAVWVALKEEDRREYNPTEEELSKDKTDTEAKVKLKPAREVEGIIKTADGVTENGLVSRVLKIVTVGGGDPPALAEVHRYDRCKAVFEIHRDYLNEDVKNLFQLVFFGGPDASDDFGKFLTANYANNPEGESETPSASEEPESELTQAEVESFRRMDDEIQAIHEDLTHPERPEGKVKKHRRQTATK